MEVLQWYNTKKKKKEKKEMTREWDCKLTYWIWIGTDMNLILVHIWEI